MEAKSRFRMLREKPLGWISGEAPSRLYLCPADLRRTERESVQEEDRESAKGRKRESETSSPIPLKNRLLQIFAISPFRDK
jgi:hypothetical protein